LFTEHTDFRPTTHHDAFCSESMQMNGKSYSMMIKLIQDLIQGIEHWQRLFCKETGHQQEEKNAFPTMASILAKAFQDDKTELDAKQLITYETICATFLLGLVNDGQDDSTTL